MSFRLKTILGVALIQSVLLTVLLIIIGWHSPNILYDALAIAVTGVLLIVLFSLLLSTYLTSQLSNLKNATKHIAAGQFGFQIPVKGADELAQTSLAFNQMSNRLKELYDRIQEEEARKSAILESALDCVISMDEDGRITEFNPAAEVLFGYTRADILGKPVAEHIVPPAYREAHRQGLEKYLNTGQGSMIGRRAEVSAMRADQTEFPAELAINAVWLNDQMQFIAYLRDITARKQAESERRWLILAIDASPDGIFISDPEGTIRYANQAFTKITGWAAADIIGQNIKVLRSESMPAGFHARMLNQLAQTKIWNGRLLIQRKNASAQEPDLVWTQMTVAPILGAAEELQGFVAIGRDITEEVGREQRQHLEHEATEIRAQVSQILQTQDPLQRRFAKAVRRIMTMIGIAAGGKSCVLLKPRAGTEAKIYLMQGDFTNDPDPRSYCRTIAHGLFSAAGEGNEILIADHSPFTPRGNTATTAVDVGHYAIPILHGGDLLGFVFLLTEPQPPRDPVRLETLRLIGQIMGLAMVNDQVQQTLEKARQAAEDAANAKSQFLANMSHEIRTPMNGVLGMLDLLRGSQIRPDQLDYVNTAFRSAELLLNIINDILDFSRIEAGQMHLEQIELDISQTVENVAATFAENAHRKQLDLASFVASDVPRSVTGDPTRLHQVLMNLVGNAIKFTDRGEVAIRVGLQEKLEGRVVLIFEVIDTGIGISPQAQERLFKPFSQADGSTSRKYGGTGLGLVISKQLVQLMGGSMTLESKLERGTRFRVVIPFDNPVWGEAAPQRSIRGLRVLIVDDTETNRIVLAHYLERWGVHYDSAIDGQEALQQIHRQIERGQPYQVVILDWQMPDMDGIELARTIRANPALSGLHLLLLSSLAQTDEIPKLAGIDLHLGKPVRQAQLYNALLALAGDQPLQRLDDKTATIVKLRGKLLLAEDNEVNQEVGLEMLKRLGLSADIAINGVQAVEAFSNNDYDLVLMDCQMPEMDGFGATRVIRGLENREKRPRTPIVALTANAMRGDRERCLAVGMDDYLAKPFSTSMLVEVLARWLIEDRKTPEKMTADAAPTETLSCSEHETAVAPELIEVAKVDELVALLGPRFATLLDKFEATSRASLDELQDAAAANDNEGLIRAAHRLRSSSGSLGAKRLLELSSALEEAARQDKVVDAEITVAEIVHAHRQACQALRQLLATKN